MKGLFRIRIGSEVIEYSDSAKIPDRFDALIAFEPEYPETPHTQEDHDTIDDLQQEFAAMLKRQVPPRKKPRTAPKMKARRPKES